MKCIAINEDVKKLNYKSSTLPGPVSFMPASLPSILLSSELFSAVFAKRWTAKSKEVFKDSTPLMNEFNVTAPKQIKL